MIMSAIILVACAPRNCLLLLVLPVDAQRHFDTITVETSTQICSRPYESLLTAASYKRLRDFCVSFTTANLQRLIRSDGL